MQTDHVYLQFWMKHKDDKDLSVLMQSRLFWEAPKQIDVLSFQLGETENQPDLESEKTTAAIFLTFWL